MKVTPLYRPINEFPKYLACSDGYVINAETGHVMAGTVKKTGYVETILIDENGKPHYRLLHRIIAEAFVENEGNKPEVNHVDGNKENNCAENLEWVTRAENLQHAYDTGLMPNNTTPRKVYAININTGKRSEFDSIYQAAAMLGISNGNICMCCKGIRPSASGYIWGYCDEADT